MSGTPSPGTSPGAPTSSGASGPRTSSRRLARVAIVLGISVAILSALIIATGPLDVVGGKTVRVDFSFAGPIKTGASVRIAGVVVGAVRSVDLLYGQDAEAGPDKMVRVTAKLEDRAAAALSDKASFRVTTLGVLGEHYLDVEPVRGGTPLQDNARVDGIAGARPDLLLSRASGLLERAEELLPTSPEARELMKSMAALMARLDTLLGDGDGGATSPANAQAVDDVRALVKDLRTLIHGAAIGVGDGNALRRTLDRMPGVLERTEALEASLDDAQVAQLVVEARTTLSRLDKTLALVDAAPLLEPAKQEQLRVDVAAAMRSIDAVAKRGDRLLGVVEAKKGGAGKLFWDEQAADDLRAVLSGLRKDPVRFLLTPGER